MKVLLVCQHDLETSPMVQIPNELDPYTLSIDIFHKSLQALEMAAKARPKGARPLHELAMDELREVRNGGDIAIWGLGGVYCDVQDEDSDYECDLESKVPCLVVREVMHGNDWVWYP